jgi:DNA adenine methylase
LESLILSSPNGTAVVEPLLKWPGGKRAIAERITGFLPRTFGRYFEPFFGGGAIFFRLAPRGSVLADVNEKLIMCYQAIRDDPEAVFTALARMKNSDRDYYRIRAKRTRSPYTAAARLIYLCTYSFNGIYRENLAGTYNVPYGYKLDHPKPSFARIREIAQALDKAELIVGDFSKVTHRARAADLVYLDPPYTLKHNSNGFVKYNAKLFTWKDQERLAAEARILRDRGVYVAISNASHEAIRALYKGFYEVMIDRYSVIAADSDKRVPVRESLYLSQPPQTARFRCSKT